MSLIMPATNTHNGKKLNAFTYMLIFTISHG